MTNVLSDYYNIVILTRSIYVDHGNVKYISLNNLTNYLRNHKIWAIIHIATCYDKNDISYKDVYKCNVELPIMLLKHMMRYNIDYFINTDTYYCKKNLLINNYKNYIKTKKIFRNYSRKYHSKLKIKFVNFSLEHIYGSGDDKSKFVNWLVDNYLCKVDEVKILQGNQVRDFIYIDDVINAYKIVIDNLSDLNNYENFYIGTGKRTSIRDFAELAAKICGYKGRLIFADNKYFSESYADIRNLIKLNWAPNYNLKEGIEAMINN